MGSTFSNMVVTTLLSSCLLMMHLNAAPVCNFHKLKHDEIGLCGPNGTTWHCPSCQPGYGQLVECGRKYPEGTKVGCVPCKENHTYSDTYDISQCKQCTRCQENEVQSGQCTRENDTIRCTCKPGYYRDRGHCKPCSWCCGDKTNEKVPECNIPQVPMAKQCSLQTAKNCAPTTHAPSTISITTYSGGKDSGESTLFQNSAGITATIVVVVIIFVALLARYCCCNERSSNSSNGDSGENSGSTSNASSSGNSSDGDSGENSGSTSNESSSATLLSEDKSVGDVNSNKPVEAHVDLKPTSTAEFHAGSKACNEVEPLLPAKRLKKEEISFICETLGKKIGDLNHDVMHTLCTMLNIPIDYKDYRNLDCLCKLNYYDKKGLEKRENPMEYIIEIMVGKSITLESFVDELYKISRGDVVEQLYEIAIEEGKNLV